MRDYIVENGVPHLVLKKYKGGRDNDFFGYISKTSPLFTILLFPILEKFLILWVFEAFSFSISSFRVSTDFAIKRF